MDAKELARETGSMTEVVSAEKANTVSTGVVKDDRTQALSTLSEKGSTLGVRAARKKAIARPRKGAAGHSVVGAESAGADTSPEAGTTQSPRPQKHDALKARQIFERKAVSELDDTDEFEGSQGAYDAGRGASRATRAIRSRKSKADSNMPGKPQGSASAKATSAQGAAKKGRAASQVASSVHAAQARHEVQAAATAAKSTAAKKGGFALAGTIGGGGLATGGGILCGTVAFVLVALLIGQMISALFGFWDNEDKKRSMEGLPPYITYEMVEEALKCQEEYGHPAGCTIAQIICESGQGETMSQLATRDHNLFGMKWATSFASAPEVAGKAGWTTNEKYTPGQIMTITAYFTVFKGDVECIRFRSRVFLQQAGFRNNALIREAISSKNSDKMAEGLKDAGWATSSSYIESLKSIMDTYNLRRFDSMSVKDLEDGALSGDAIVQAAYSQLGVPYVWGGTTPGVGLDCSGLTQYCYAKAGIAIPRNSEDQAAFGRKVPVSQATPGDILWRPGHVAIYIGDNRYIHEPHSGAVCTIATGASYFTSAIKIR